MGAENDALLAILFHTLEHLLPLSANNPACPGLTKLLQKVYTTQEQP